ncbi:MAG: DUF4412 domain-containing protein [Alphaproteobacteria bacterium]|nr:DUF4412 domain-containing protein [Alphaproteobacteria bacterium]
MWTRIKVAAATAAFLAVGANAASADSYTGPGFAGVAWAKESNQKAVKFGAINVGAEGLKMDIEQQGQRVSIIRLWDADVAFSLMHDQKMYMEIPPEQTGWDDYSEEACTGFEKGEKLGSETVNGRDTEKWSCTGQAFVPEGSQAADATVWYDPKLKFAIKSIDADGNEFEVKDIKVGAQKSSMYEIPAGYQKFDMNAMMQQMMQQGQQ